jgi:maleate cis-trans isomerase
MNGIAPAKLGFIYPLGGAEYEYYQFADDSGGAVRCYLVATRIFGEDRDHDIQHLRRTGSIANLEDAAARLAPLRPDVVMWACTSGSFVDGREHAEQQAAAIGRIVGCPASSTSLAFASALKMLDAKKVALIASYPEDVARAFVAFLNEFDVEVGQFAWLGAPAGPGAARFTIDEIVTMARNMDLDGIDAILVPDTAIPGFKTKQALEEACQLPAITANQATIWEALRLCGKTFPPAVDLTTATVLRTLPGR